jgi:hypothetical protein
VRTFLSEAEALTLEQALAQEGAAR